MNSHFNEIKKSLGTIKGRVEARNEEVKELKQRLDTLDANAAKRDSRVTASGPSGVEKFCRDLNLSGAEGAVQEQQLTPEEAGFDQEGGLINRLLPTLASSDRIVVPTYDGRKHEGPFCPEGALLGKPDSATGSVSRPSRPWRSRWAAVSGLTAAARRTAAAR